MDTLTHNWNLILDLFKSYTFWCTKPFAWWVSKVNIKSPIVINHMTDFSLDSDSGSQFYYTPSRSQESRDDLETSTLGLSDPHLTDTKHYGEKKHKCSSSQTLEDSQNHFIDIFWMQVWERWEDSGGCTCRRKRRQKGLWINENNSGGASKTCR